MDLKSTSFLILIFSFALAAYIGSNCDQTLKTYPHPTDILFHGLGSYYDRDDEETPYQRIANEKGVFNLEFGFLNFNRDELKLKLEIEEYSVLDASMDFGYTDEGLQAINDWYEDSVYTDSLEQEYINRKKRYLNSRGFKLLTDNSTLVDIAKLVRENKDHLNSVAMILQEMADENNYDPDEILGAAIAMVQTAIVYKQPPAVRGTLHTGGVLPPLTTLTGGWGDCDTKTALLASILLNWDNVMAVGVGVPGHYLMGIQMIPERGNAFVEYDGATYVLLEPAGPAWAPPGEVSDQTLAYLDLNDGISIDPF
ncbi:hypothetical protein ACFL6Y_10980 [Elusimicrobiota bacterium]